MKKSKRNGTRCRNTSNPNMEKLERRCFMDSQGNMDLLKTNNICIGCTNNENDAGHCRFLDVITYGASYCDFRNRTKYTVDGTKNER